MRAGVFFVFALALAACGGPVEEPPSVRMTVEAAHPVTAPEIVDEAPVLDISDPALAKITEIRQIIARNSLTRLSRLANQEPSFVSNFSGEAHRIHWDLLRRTGFDPLAQLGTLLDGPYATRTVGDEVWYVWPDLAALNPDQLVPERLSFSDRARLLELVGEVGVERIRGGQGYPGVRTAIAEDGRWLYFVHETEDETSEGE